MKKLLSFLLIASSAFAQNSTYIKGPTLIESITQVVTAAGTTNLTSASNTNYRFSGSSTQTVNLPDATTVPLGRHFAVFNASSGNVTIKDAGSSTLAVLATNQSAQIVLTATGSSAGTWGIGVAGTAAGTGDVAGPSGATANAIARYSGTTGKIIKDSSVVIDDLGQTRANLALVTSNSGEYSFSAANTTAAGTGAGDYTGFTSTLTANQANNLAQGTGFGSTVSVSAGAGAAYFGYSSAITQTGTHANDFFNFYSADPSTLNGNSYYGLYIAGVSSGTISGDNDAVHVVAGRSYFGGNVLVNGLAASRALVSDASKNLSSSSVTSTELGYVSGVTSAIQTQLNTKVSSVGISVPAASIFGTSGTPVTSSGTLGITTTGTSGGIPYFSSTSALSTSGALTASQLVLGGGAGSSPTSLAAGSQYVPLTMGASNPGYTALALNQSAATSGSLLNSRGGTGTDSSASTGIAHVASGTWTYAAVDVSSADATGTLAAGRFPALTGDVTTLAGALATTIGSGKVTNGMLAGSIDLTAKVTGTLPLANGGTNGTDAAVNGGLVWSNASGYKVTAAGTSGQGVYSGGAGTPVFKYGTVTSVTSGSTALATSDDIIQADATSGDVTLTLAAASTLTGKIYHLYNTASANKTIIDPSGAETICGQTTINMAGGDDSIDIYDNGTAWRVLNGGCNRSFTAQINCSSSSSIGSSTPPSLLTAIGNVSGGNCAVTIKTGVFSGTPRCVASDDGVAGTPKIIAATGASATSFQVDCANDAGTACTTYTANVICTGSR